LANLSSITSVTGCPITGLTNPTYTLSSDVAPMQHQVQRIVSALGGTQTGVVPHSLASPFTLTIMKEKVPVVVRNPSATGFYSVVPYNKFAILTRKGVMVSAVNPAYPSPLLLQWRVPANSENYDKVELCSQLSFTAGLLYNNPDAVMTLVTQNVP